jgi:hypothetical protein
VRTYGDIRKKKEEKKIFLLIEKMHRLFLRAIAGRVCGVCFFIGKNGV